MTKTLHEPQPFSEQHPSQTPAPAGRPGGQVGRHSGQGQPQANQGVSQSAGQSAGHGASRSPAPANFDWNSDTPIGAIETQMIAETSSNDVKEGWRMVSIVLGVIMAVAVLRFLSGLADGFSPAALLSFAFTSAVCWFAYSGNRLASFLLILWLTLQGLTILLTPLMLFSEASEGFFILMGISLAFGGTFLAAAGILAFSSKVRAYRNYVS